MIDAEDINTIIGALEYQEEVLIREEGESDCWYQNCIRNSNKRDVEEARQLRDQVKSELARTKKALGNIRRMPL